MKEEELNTMDITQNKYDLYLHAAKSFSRILNIPINQALQYTPLLRRYTWMKSKYIQDNKKLEISRLLFNTSELNLASVIEEQKTLRQKNIQETVWENFGCFSLKHKDWIIQIHFSPWRFYSINRKWPLSKENEDTMRNDLRRLFLYIKRTHPQAQQVQGNSWIHSVPAYQRLFPERKFNKSVEAYESNALRWQFLDSQWKLKEYLVESFYEKLILAKNIQDIDNSFPVKQSVFSTPIDNYYKFYWIE